MFEECLKTYVSIETVNLDATTRKEKIEWLVQIK